MGRSEAASDQPQPAAVDVDVIVVGAGIMGLYQLYRAREAGFSVRLLEAGDGVGGVWYWNRYPGARFDSESYTYAYLFSQELFNEWYWTEHFAGQPEIERYLNYVTDRFDLRRHITFGARVMSMEHDDPCNAWVTRTESGAEVRSRFVVAATGNLSAPYLPDVPGRDVFQGQSLHTGLWPKTPVDLLGKRVAVIGTGASGVQIVPAIADEVASLTVYQRTSNWSVPLNNRPITDEEQAELRGNFVSLREKLNASLSGFIHAPHTKKTFEDSPEERTAFYEKMWRAPGFATIISNYTDLTSDRAANAEFSAFLADKIRGIVNDPGVAEKLIPKDHGYAGKRPPYSTNYYEAYNKANVSLVDLTQTPIVRVTRTGVETSDGERPFDVLVWATGFDFGTGALSRMGVRGKRGLSLNEHWTDGPRTFLGFQSAGFPNLFFPAGPHSGGGNNPRVGGNQVDYITDAMTYVRDHGYRAYEVPQAREDEWMTMIDTLAEKSSYLDSSYFFGGNIPGKPHRLLVNAAGRSKLLELMKAVVDSQYDGFLS